MENEKREHENMLARKITLDAYMGCADELGMREQKRTTNTGFVVFADLVSKSPAKRPQEITSSVLGGACGIALRRHAPPVYGSNVYALHHGQHHGGRGSAVLVIGPGLTPRRAWARLASGWPRETRVWSLVLGCRYCHAEISRSFAAAESLPARPYAKFRAAIAIHISILCEYSCWISCQSLELGQFVFHSIVDGSCSR